MGATGGTRIEAIDRMDAALADTRIAGVNTTIGMCRTIMQNDRFREGGVSIDFLPSLVSGAAARA